MEKLPDCASIDESSLDMDEETSSDELGELRCSDLDIPLFTYQIFEPVIRASLHFITNEQWVLLGTGHIDSNMNNLLSNMCHQIVDIMSALILETVAPQVLTRMQGQIDLDSASSPTTTSVTMDRNFYSVTEEDIQASIGDSFHLCFGVALGVGQLMSHHSDKLTELFAAVVNKKVNQSLALIRGLASSTQPQESAAELEAYEAHTKDMVYYTTCILRRCRLNRFQIRCEGPADSDSSEDSCPDEVTDVQEFYEEDSEKITSVSESCSSVLSPSQSSESSASSAEELPQRETFVAVFLRKLVEHIADSTKTSVSDMDFDGMLTRVRQRTVGEFSTIPETVGNTHIPIYKKLCKEFGSAKMLQSAMASASGIFEEAVIQILRAQLQTSTRKNTSFVKKVRRFFCRRTRKVAPACENTSVSHSEVTDEENGSKTPLLRNKKRPTTMKTLSSMARILRKPFNSCINGGSDDH